LPLLIRCVFGGFSAEKPLRVPLIVPVAFRVAEDLEDDHDSLASLNGVVR
jgi:hypothetical protein